MYKEMISIENGSGLVRSDKLKIGDKIGIVATSSQIDLPFDAKQKAYEFLRRKSFVIEEAENITASIGHTAGSIEDRVDSFHKLVADQSVRAIMSFWGGYNSNQLLDFLDFDLIKKNPKIYISYSDFTVLTLAITEFSKLITYVGPSVVTFSKPNPLTYTWKYFEKFCIQNKDTVIYKSSPFYTDDLQYIAGERRTRQNKINPGLVVYRDGNGEGRIVCANIISLATLLGTKYFPNLDDKVLFLEEAEYVNTAMIDRALTQLKQAGALTSLNGLVFGRFMEQTGFNWSDNFGELLNNLVINENFPILCNVDFGHTDQ